MSAPVIGLALGSGSARGWSHFGVIRALAERGIRPDVVSGTSIGALVGACLAAGSLDEMEEWVRALTRRDVMSLLDIKLSGGLIAGERLFEQLRATIGEDLSIEGCELPYGAVATNLATGNEIWLREGGLLEAVRASIALPGLFTPVKRAGRWLVDGGLVNPVPVSLCRAMGADLVIAVDLNSDLLERYPMVAQERKQAVEATGHAESWLDRFEVLVEKMWPWGREDDDLPSFLEVLARSTNIMSVRITRSRMAGDPPDILLAPRLAHIGLMDFHLAAPAIEEGRAEVERQSRQLEYLGL